MRVDARRRGHATGATIGVTKIHARRRARFRVKGTILHGDFSRRRISAKLAVVAHKSAGVHGNYYGEVACMSYGRDLHSADPPHRLYFISSV